MEFEQMHIAIDQSINQSRVKEGEIRATEGETDSIWKRDRAIRGCRVSS